MSALKLDGKRLAGEIRSRLRSSLEDQVVGSAPSPGLATVLVGDDPASHIYVRNKRRACAEVGIESLHYDLPKETSEIELVELVDQLNGSERVHGILVQLPLPKGVDEQKVLDRIDPAKDVDGFHPRNIGSLVTGQKGLLPCTPTGVMRLLQEAGVDPSGQRALVVGRSNIVGKPAALMLLRRHATVTIAHSRTRDLKGLVREAEILVAAIGRPEMIPGDWIREGSIVIDVGTNRIAPKKLVGDVDYTGVIAAARSNAPA